MATTDTVISHKESFLRTQVRILSQPLQPSRNWRDRARVPEEGELKEKVVQEVLRKRMWLSLYLLSYGVFEVDFAEILVCCGGVVNTIARHHNRAVYSSQALRHVAEQIDALYWAAAAPDQEAEIRGEDVLEKGLDLSTAEWVSTWASWGIDV